MNEIFTPEELLWVTTQARHYFIDTNPEVCLPGKNVSLTESQFHAICWIRAVADLLYKKGLASSVMPRLDIPGTEPDIEE